MQYPIILGNNAGGFPHGFLGTSRPVDLWLFRAHGRVVWGQLAQSDFSSVTGPARRRWAAGIVAAITPRWVRGLEIGASRFSHSPWPAGGPDLEHFTRPFRSQFRENVAGVEDNQLASAFFRWVFPASGLELWGEYGREDYNIDLRDFVQEPDHIGGFTLGFRKAVRRAPTDLWFVRGEVQSLQISQLDLARGQTPFYVHSSLAQGHTHRGQILASAAGLGGSASLLALDRYFPEGRWTVFVSRELRQDRADFLDTDQVDPRGLDVQLAAGTNGVLFRGPYDVTAGLTLVYELNRDFRRDAVNLHLTVGVRGPWR